jgi:peptidylprolyl isomerase
MTAMSTTRPAAIIALVAALALPGCGSSDSSTDDPTGEGATDATSSAECPPEDGTAERTTSFDAPPPMCIDEDATYLVEVQTSAGSFTIELDPSEAPLAVNNFVVLARNHYYDGVAFHRIIPGFVIQGGDANGEPPGTGDAGYEFADELPDSADDYVPGSVAMANSGPDTNGSQFFIVLESGGLDPLYSLFGQVTEGFDTTIQDIAATGTPSGEPTSETLIETITVTER